MYILDTDTLSHLHAGRPQVVERLRRLDDTDVRVTIVTKIELLRGRFDFLLKAATGVELLRAQYWLARTETLLTQIPILLIDEAAAAQFDRLKTVKVLSNIGRTDLLIASVALANRAVLVTRNVRHFKPVPGLKVENWVD